MKTFLASLSQATHQAPTRLIAFFTLLSMLLGAWMLAIQHGRINIDSVLYIEAAKRIAEGNWQAAMAIYNWPFYSTCLAITHKITRLDIEQAAQLLNTLFFGITAFSFLNIVRLSGGKKLEIIAGVILLFSARHLIGVMLPIPMRDQGFWAFFLTAIFFMLRFMQHQRMRDATFWQLAILVAALFRVEGFAYLLLLPIVVLLTPAIAHKRRAFLQHYSLIFVFGVCMLVYATLTQEALFNASRLQEVMPNNAWHDITQELASKSMLMSEILGRYLQQYTWVIIVISFLVIIVIKVLNAVGMVNVGLALLTSINKKSRLDAQAYRVLIYALLIGIGTLVFTLVKTFVIVGRYTAPLAFILLILAAFSIRVLVDCRKRSPFAVTAMLLFLSVFCAINFIKNVTPGSDETFYQKQATIWLAQHNTTQAPVLYGDMLLAYYASAPYSAARRNDMAYLRQELPANALNYEYVIIENGNAAEKKEKDQLLQTLQPNFEELKRFGNTAKKYVAIYKKRPAAN